MAKSFCDGCKYYVWLDDGLGEPFHYCAIHKVWRLKDRKKFCNGKHIEK